MSPAVTPPSTDWLASKFKRIENDIAALAKQQNQYVLDGNSTMRVKVGWHQADNSYGVSIFDPSGNRRVALGQLPNGDHGIELIDVAGNKQELLPAADDYVGTTLPTTSGTPVGLSGSPFVNITIGASGDCEITAGAFVGYPTAGSANAYLVIDGGTPVSIFGGSGSSAAAGNLQSTRRISTWLPTIFPLSPGGHSFTMAYAATGGTGNFSANYLKLQPL